MAKRFGNYSLFGIKNSFIAFLLPLFIEAAKELGYTPKIVAILRDPTETAHSWRKRMPSTSGTMENLYEMIGKCFLSMMLYGLEESFLPIYFNHLFSNTEHVITKLHNFLPGSYSYNAIQEDLATFLDIDLKHENNSLT